MQYKFDKESVDNGCCIENAKYIVFTLEDSITIT